MSSSGRIPNKPLSLARACSTALLALALIGAQFAGVKHRIEHAPVLDDHSAYALLEHDHDHEDDRLPTHDCAAYDAAAVGDGPPLAQSRWISDPTPKALVAALVSKVADTSPQLPFHSRAPPRA